MQRVRISDARVDIHQAQTSKEATAAEAIPLPRDEATPPVINTYCITDNPDTELNNLYQDNNFNCFQELLVLLSFLPQN